MTDTEQTLSLRTERILQASAYAAAQFLHTPSWELCIDDVLARLGAATGSDLVYLIRVSDHHAPPRMRVRNYWHARPADRFIPVDRLALSDWAASTFAPWVEKMRNQQPIACHAADLSPCQQELLTQLKVETVYLLPVFAATTWWGMILFEGDAGHSLTTTEFDALRLIADSLGSAINRRHFERQLQRRNHELHVLNSVIAAANAALEPHTVLTTTCRELALAFHASTAGAALVDETGSALEIVAEYITAGNFSALGEKIPITGNVSTEYVLRERKPLVVEDVRSDPRFESIRDIMAQRGVASIILLPLTAGDEVVGTLGLDTLQPRRFSEEEVALAMSAASAASQVLAKAHLLTAERENTARLQQILQLTTGLVATRDEQDLLNLLVQKAAHFSPSGICSVFMREVAGRDLILRACHGLPSSALGLRISQDEPLVKQALAGEKPLIIPDIAAHAPELLRFLVSPDTCALSAYPLLSEHGPLGFISFSSPTVRHPSPAEISALSLLAERVAAAIQNVRLLNAVSAQASHLSALHEVDLAISTSLEPEEVYETITQSAAQLLGCDLVNLYRWLPEQGEIETLSTYGAARENIKGRRFDVRRNQAHLELRQGQRTIAIPDIRNDPRIDNFWRDNMGVRAVLLVPLLYRDAFSGMLALNDTCRARHWSDAEIELAQSLAAQASIAVANARLHAETRHLLDSSQRQARLVQQIVDTVSDGLLLLDPQHRVVLANPAAQQFLQSYVELDGERVAALAGSPLARFLQPPPADRAFHEVKIRNSKNVTFEISAHQMEADPLAGGWVIAIHDATRDREQQAYLQAQDRLATVGQLAAGIAHDFNNILAVIVLYAQTLQRDDIPVRDRERLRAIYMQAQRASSLIAQILDFSRRSVVERRPLELQPFLHELLQMLRRTLPETINVELRTANGDAIVNVDPTRLQQALMNLALNARDAITASLASGTAATGDLSITLTRHDASWKPPLPDMQRGDWVAIGVADSGAGIKPDVLPHIFEPFFTTKMPGQGTGLGLAQVYGIVKQHDGFIDVHSAPGKGATFHIYLPAICVLTSGPSEELAPVRAGGGELILVVEDEPAIQSAVGEILELLGYRVLMAGDGLEALETYQQAGGAIDLVLSDMVMPRMNGATLYHNLRSLNPHIRLVLFTGYPLDEPGRKFVEAESVPWLQKPFNAETLGAIIHRALHPEDAKRDNEP